MVFNQKTKIKGQTIMTSRYFCRSFTNVTFLYFFSHSNDNVMIKEFGRERLVQRRAILLSPQCGDTTSCIRQANFVNFKGKRT
jgi:hypothetical protein